MQTESLFTRFRSAARIVAKRLPSFQAVRTDSILEMTSQRERRPKIVFIDRVSREFHFLAEAATKRGAIIYFEPSAVSPKRLFDEFIEFSAHCQMFARPII